ncbi:MAG TPA: hypothetical protein PK771_14110 [Spirochaetota bacterium]|nr:hypothetical protein [Spirochaetota bacterium]
MKKNERPEFVFSNSKSFLLYVGFFIIFVFFLIYLIIAVKTQKIDYISFFFNNIIQHIFYTILAGFHVSILGIGILIILIVFLQTSLTIRCYSDRFEINLFLQKKKIVYFSDIKSVNMDIIFYNEFSILKNKNYKEARVFFNNPIYNFSLGYKVEGYFDNMLSESKEEKSDFYNRKCPASKSEVEEILNKLKKYCQLNNFYLPEEIEQKKHT